MRSPQLLIKVSKFLASRKNKKNHKLLQKEILLIVMNFC